jgi:hypothetical protein
MRFVLAFMSLCSASALAQSAGVPHLGWVRGGEAGTVEAVIGIPGAALVSRAEGIGSAERILIRPGSAMALVSMQEGAAAVARLDRLAQEDGVQPLPGALEHASIAAWSPMGARLILASAAESRVQVWQAEGEGLSLLRELPVAAERAAVSDSGEMLAQIDGVLYWIGESGAMQEVTRSLNGGFTFLAGTSSYAWLEDSGLWIAGGGETVFVPLPEVEGARLLASPVRGGLVLVEPHGESAVLSYWNGKGEKLGEWECPAAVSGVAATGAEGVLRLVTEGGGPVWMAEFGQASGRVFFVPRVQEGGDEQ